MKNTNLMLASMSKLLKNIKKHQSIASLWQADTAILAAQTAGRYQITQVPMAACSNTLPLTIGLPPPLSIEAITRQHYKSATEAYQDIATQTDTLFGLPANELHWDCHAIGNNTWLTAGARQQQVKDVLTRFPHCQVSTPLFGLITLLNTLEPQASTPIFYCHQQFHYQWTLVLKEKQVLHAQTWPMVNQPIGQLVQAEYADQRLLCLSPQEINQQLAVSPAHFIAAGLAISQLQRKKS